MEVRDYSRFLEKHRTNPDTKNKREGQSRSDPPYPPEKGNSETVQTSSGNGNKGQIDHEYVKVSNSDKTGA